MSYLAEVVAGNDMVSLGALGTFIAGLASIAVAFVKRESFRKQGRDEVQQNNVTLTGQPISVKMEDHFVTRREFDRLEKMIRTDVLEMKTLFRLAMDRMEAMNKESNAKIEAVAAGAYQSRGKIHEKVNNHGERIKSLEDRQPAPRRN